MKQKDFDVVKAEIVGGLKTCLSDGGCSGCPYQYTPPTFCKQKLLEDVGIFMSMCYETEILHKAYIELVKKQATPKEDESND